MVHTPMLLDCLYMKQRIYCYPQECIFTRNIPLHGFVIQIKRKVVGLLFGSIAQLVEQRTENPCVGGSNPPRATTYAAVAQLVRAPGCGPGGRQFKSTQLYQKDYLFKKQFASRIRKQFLYTGLVSFRYRLKFFINPFQTLELIRKSLLSPFATIDF